MILVDTSAWIEYLRDTGGPACERVTALLASEEPFATCHPVRMELLAGARDDRHLAGLRGLLARGTLLSTIPADYEIAAQMYRQCRQRGETVRKLIDCLIAAHAVRIGVPILHADGDYSVLARHTSLTEA